MKFFIRVSLALFLVCLGAFPLQASSMIDVEHNFSLSVDSLIPTKTSIDSFGYYQANGVKNPFPDGHFEYIDPMITSAQLIYDSHNQCIVSSTLSHASVSLKTQYPVSQAGFNWLTFNFNVPAGGSLLNIKDTWTYHYILNGEASYYSYALLKIDETQYYYPWKYLDESRNGDIDSGIITSYVDFSLSLSSGNHSLGFYSGTSQDIVPLPNTMLLFGSSLIILISSRNKLRKG